jgi:hypothetical protein
MTDTKQPESHTTLYDVCQEVLRLESVNAELLEALEHSKEWIQKSPHGDNCYVSNHHEADQGNRCNCSKESIENFLLAAIAKAEVKK